MDISLAWARTDRTGELTQGECYAASRFHARLLDTCFVEAVTSHIPVDPKRRAELNRLFAGATAELVFVTAFLNRRAMTEYLGAISWQTDVWIAEQPSHLIHFDGERFLGPY